MEDQDKELGDRIREGRMTYEWYAKMPEDGQRYEIFDGVLEMMSPGPYTRHQAVSGELEFILKQSCRTDYLIYDAPLDVILSDRDVLQPDILMIHRSRQRIVTFRGVEGPPDLVVEILSAGSRKRDKVVKLGTYAKFGVPEYWIVDIDARTLEQYRPAAEGRYELFNLFEKEDTVQSDKLPCASFVLGDIFKEIPNFGAGTTDGDS